MSQQIQKKALFCNIQDIQYDRVHIVTNTRMAHSDSIPVRKLSRTWTPRAFRSRTKDMHSKVSYKQHP